MPLRPLPLPSHAHPSLKNPALQLFVDRARMVAPGFALTDANIATLTAIVSTLDGLPLAIELAASRVHLMPPQVLNERLSQRFRLLRRSRWSGPERHMTLRAALDWAWELLGPCE